MSLTLNLTGPPPWGFRLTGGRDFKKTITVSKVVEGSKADLANLQVGDILVEINGENATEMLNMEAQRKIRNSRMQLVLLVQRPPGQTSRSGTLEQLAEHFQGVLQADQDENQNYRVRAFSSPSSISSGPFLVEPPASPERKSAGCMPSNNKSVWMRTWSLGETTLHHRPSRTPSEESSSSDHRSCLVSSRTPSPPEHPLSPRRSLEQTVQKNTQNSAVYKMIQGLSGFRTAPQQSNTFRVLQEALEAKEKETQAKCKVRPLSGWHQPFSSKAGEQNRTSPTCESTQAVRITEGRYRHAECYVCTHCNLSLRALSHAWVGEDLLCEKHAKERHQGCASGPQR